MSAIACAPQASPSAVDDAKAYSTEQEQAKQGWFDNHPTYDSDGDPMLCEADGMHCRRNPAYDAYRYRQFGYNQFPNNYGNFQPAPVVPVFTLSY